MAEVFATKGPRIGRFVQVPDDELEAATAESGWAIKIEPGNVLHTDPSAPYDPAWVIPGYTHPIDEIDPTPPDPEAPIDAKKTTTKTKSTTTSK